MLEEPLGATELHALTDDALIDELRALREEEAALAAVANQHQSLLPAAADDAADDDDHPTDDHLASSPDAPSLVSDKENGARAAAELARKADVGERLYQNALDCQQRKRQAATQQAVERALQAAAEVRATPEINELSSKLVGERPSDCVKRLHAHGAAVSARREALAAEVERVARELSTRSKASAASLRIASERHSGPVVERLLAAGAATQAACPSHAEADEHSFAPTINNSSRRLAKRAAEAAGFESTPTHERLYSRHSTPQPGTPPPAASDHVRTPTIDKRSVELVQRARGDDVARRPEERLLEQAAQSAEQRAHADSERRRDEQARRKPLTNPTSSRILSESRPNETPEERLLRGTGHVRPSVLAEVKRIQALLPPKISRGTRKLIASGPQGDGPVHARLYEWGQQRIRASTDPGMADRRFQFGADGGPPPIQNPLPRKARQSRDPRAEDAAHEGAAEEEDSAANPGAGSEGGEAGVAKTNAIKADDEACMPSPELPAATPQLSNLSKEADKEADEEADEEAGEKVSEEASEKASEDAGEESYEAADAVRGPPTSPAEAELVAEAIDAAERALMEQIRRMDTEAELEAALAVAGDLRRKFDHARKEAEEARSKANEEMRTRIAAESALADSERARKAAESEASALRLRVESGRDALLEAEARVATAIAAERGAKESAETQLAMQAAASKLQLETAREELTAARADADSARVEAAAARADADLAREEADASREALAGAMPSETARVSVVPTDVDGIQGGATSTIVRFGSEELSAQAARAEAKAARESADMALSTLRSCQMQAAAAASAEREARGAAARDAAAARAEAKRSADELAALRAEVAAAKGEVKSSRRDASRLQQVLARTQAAVARSATSQRSAEEAARGATTECATIRAQRRHDASRHEQQLRSERERHQRAEEELRESLALEASHAKVQRDEALRARDEAIRHLEAARADAEDAFARLERDRLVTQVASSSRADFNAAVATPYGGNLRGRGDKPDLASTSSARLSAMRACTDEGRVSAAGPLFASGDYRMRLAKGHELRRLRERAERG